MKWIIFLLLPIMTLLPHKLNALDIGGLKDNAQVKEINILMDKIKAARKDPATAAAHYKLEREEILSKDKSCIHCPKHLLLTEQINKVMDTMAKDPSKNLGKELPIKINHLKFLYYTQALVDNNGNIDCKRYMDHTPDLKPTKFDGQFNLIAEDALRFDAVTSIQYMNPEFKEMVYYYKGEGANSDIVVQAILTKDGGKFRYFRYTPSDLEKNPYNLPDMGKSDGPDKSFLSETPVAKAYIVSGSTIPGEPALFNTNADEGAIGSAKIGTDGLSVKFKSDIDKQHKIIPKNIHFLETNVDQEFGGLKIKATSDTSLKGNSAKMSLKKEGGDDLVTVDLDTKFSGKSEHRVSVPYSIRVMEEAQVSVKGKLQHETNAQILTMSISDQSTEYIRSEYRKNTANNTDSYVLARDIQISPKEIVSVQYGKGEDDKKYASVKHVKELKNNITLVLDVKLGANRQTSVFYSISAKF